MQEEIDTFKIYCELRGELYLNRIPKTGNLMKDGYSRLDLAEEFVNKEKDKINNEMESIISKFDGDKDRLRKELIDFQTDFFVRISNLIISS